MDEQKNRGIDGLVNGKVIEMVGQVNGINEWMIIQSMDRNQRKSDGKNCE